MMPILSIPFKFIDERGTAKPRFKKRKNYPVWSETHQKNTQTPQTTTKRTKSCPTLENVTPQRKYSKSWPQYQRERKRRDRIFELLTGDPPMSKSDIARILRVSRMTVHRVAGKMKRRLLVWEVTRNIERERRLRERFDRMSDVDKLIWATSNYYGPPKGRPRGRPFTSEYQPRWTNKNDEVRSPVLKEGLKGSPRSPDVETLEKGLPSNSDPAEGKAGDVRPRVDGGGEDISIASDDLSLSEGPDASRSLSYTYDKRRRRHVPV